MSEFKSYHEAAVNKLTKQFGRPDVDTANDAGILRHEIVAFWYDKGIYLSDLEVFIILISEEDKIVDHFTDGHWVMLGDNEWDRYANWKAERILLKETV